MVHMRCVKTEVGKCDITEHVKTLVYPIINWDICDMCISISETERNEIFIAQEIVNEK